jgi:hypothetical protein
MGGRGARGDRMTMSDIAAPALPAPPRLRRVLTTALHDAAYLTIGLATSGLAFAVAVAGVTLTLSLALFLVGLPVFVASAYAFRWTAELDRRNAALVHGRFLRGRYRRSEPGFWALFKTRVADPRTWKDLAWLLLHSVVGFGFGTAAVTGIAVVFGTAALPAWYWAIPDGLDWGVWTIDTLGEAAVTALAAIPAAAVMVVLLRGMAWAESALALVLLDDEAVTHV